MQTIYANDIQTTGHTPLVKLNHVVPQRGADVLVKVEARNPTFSVKSRIARSMIEDAVQRGVLKPGGTIVEPTSGNTGIALAGAASALGFKAILTRPETMSVERREILAALGAQLVLTPGPKGMKGALEKAGEIAMNTPGAVILQQFENPANPAAHERTTGPEIWEQTDGKVDVFVAGVGTGGTITGVARFFKHVKNAPLLTVAVEPVESPVISQTLAGEPLQPAPHKIQGIGAGFIPKTLDLKLIDRVETISSDEAIAFARRLMREEGLLVGISSGAAVAAAVRLAGLPQFKGKTIAAILPDGGERYLSTPLFKQD